MANGWWWLWLIKIVICYSYRMLNSAVEWKVNSNCWHFVKLFCVSKLFYSLQHVGLFSFFSTGYWYWWSGKFKIIKNVGVYHWDPTTYFRENKTQIKAKQVRPTPELIFISKVHICVQKTNLVPNRFGVKNTKSNK